MEITEIEKQDRIDMKGPGVFVFHSEFGTMKTDKKLAMTAKNKVGIYRPRAAITLPREKAGALIVAAEQAEFRRKKEIYILYEFQTMDAGILLDHLLEVRELMHIKQIYSRLTAEESQFLAWRNGEGRLEQKKDLLIALPPLATDGGFLSYHLNVLKDLSRPGKERLFFRYGSNLPQELAQMPNETFTATDTEYPMLATVAYLVSAMILYETVEPDMIYPTKTKYDPLDFDRPDPPGVKLMYDIFRDV